VRRESRQLKLRGGRRVEHVAYDLGVVLDELARGLQPRRQSMARRDARRLPALRLAQRASRGGAWGAGAALRACSSGAAVVQRWGAWEAAARHERGKREGPAGRGAGAVSLP